MTIAYQGKQTKFVTKTDLARQHIQEMILSGVAKAGDRITSRTVSEALGISETPIREAMRSLAAEGWLQSHAHHGAVVAFANVDQIGEIYAIRGALGAVAIQLGGRSYSARRIKDIGRNLAESEKAVAAGDAVAYGYLNREFHTLLCDTPNTQWVLKLLNNLTAHTAAFHRGFSAVPERLRGSLDEHYAIRQAVEEGNYDLAAKLVAEHERKAGTALAKKLSETQ